MCTARIYVDADACPVREEIEKVATRYKIHTFLVCNGGVRPSQNPLIELVIVSSGADKADDWIAEHADNGDVVVTSDVPLADRIVRKGATGIRPDGVVWNENSIGNALATRNLISDLRESGAVQTHAPSFTAQDRSKFLQALDRLLQQSKNVQT